MPWALVLPFFFAFFSVSTTMASMPAKMPIALNLGSIATAAAFASRFFTKPYLRISTTSSSALSWSESMITSLSTEALPSLSSSTTVLSSSRYFDFGTTPPLTTVLSIYSIFSDIVVWLFNLYQSKEMRF